MSVAGIEQIDAMYRGEFRSPGGTVMLPPWEIGKPQPAMVNVVASGQVRGRVLDVGCGTGELALYIAALGHPVVGIDAAPTAIARRGEEGCGARRLCRLRSGRRH